MMRRRVGILGGTGFAPDGAGELLEIETPYGDVDVRFLADANEDLFLIHRHGRPHAPPHRVNHLANLEALARCRVDAVLAINAVGTLDERVPVGSLLVPDDWLDLTGSSATFHDTSAIHIDVSNAYCPALRADLIAAARAEGLVARDGGVYAAMRGPRLETRAEIRALRALGGTVVGMTGCPEAGLARERGLCYASLCMVTNAAAGISPADLTAHEIGAAAAALAPSAVRVLRRAAGMLDATRACACRDAARAGRLHADGAAE